MEKIIKAFLAGLEALFLAATRAGPKQMLAIVVTAPADAGRALHYDAARS